MPVKRVAIITGKYGGFRAMLPLIRLFRDSPNWDPIVYAIDQHIRVDGSQPASVELFQELRNNLRILVSRAPIGSSRVCELMELGSQLAMVFDRQAPSLVVVYGDRLDAVVGAIVAQQMGIPVAHLQAGDRSGNLDDQLRDAITSLSTIAFCSTEAARRRLDWIPPVSRKNHLVGDHHVDAVLNCTPDFSKADKIGKPYIVAHLHPDTLLSHIENKQIADWFWNELKNTGKHVAAIRPCTDTHNDAVWSNRVCDTQYEYLPLEQYVGLMLLSDGLVGNSSACLIDAPALGVPSLVVGNRQRGRDGMELVPNALNRSEFSEALRWIEGRALKQSLYFGDGTACQQTFDVLETL